MNEGVNKSVIAELFGVSRSAVTQSQSNKTLETDLQIRISKYLMPNDMDKAQSDGTVLSLVRKKAARLTKKAEILIRKRNSKLDNHKHLGRPSSVPNMNYMAYIIGEVESTLVACIQETEEEEDLAAVPKFAFKMIKFVYSFLGVRNLQWKRDIEIVAAETEEAEFGTRNTAVITETHTDTQILSEYDEVESHYADNWTIPQKLVAMVPDSVSEMMVDIYKSGNWDEDSVHWPALLPKTCPEGHPVQYKKA